MSPAPAQHGADPPPIGPILDVWSRSARRYRVRAILMLLLLAVLFGGLCCFMFWLRTGTMIPWRHESYREILLNSLRPTGPEQVTLSSFLTWPIPVREVPIHSVIIGVQFAALMSIPLVVAILYRLPSAVIFAAMIAFLAAMPWLGLTVMCGCILACMGRFRFTFRYASALVGLIPCALYLVMASWEPAGGEPKPPHSKALIYAPWVLAMLASCIICAVALALARLINFRPGGIPPVLAALFALPVLLFHTQVGRDELEYRILEAKIGPGNASIFAPVDIAAEAKASATSDWDRAQGISFDSLYEQRLLARTRAVVRRAAAHRDAVISHCDDYIEQFPSSRYVPNVLYLKGRAQDCREDRTALRERWRAEYRFDRPSPASRRTWETLAIRFSESDVAAVALHRLAILRLRDGDLEGCRAALHQLISRFDRPRPPPSAAQERGDVVDAVFRKAAPATRLDLDVNALVQASKRLQEMIAACGGDARRSLADLFGARPDGSDADVSPIQALFMLDEADPHYPENLRGILAAFPESVTAGYVRIRLALLEPSPTRRLAALREIAGSLRASPAGAEAGYHLADALFADSSLEEARAAYEAVAAAHPQSCWSEAGRRRLEAMGVLLDPSGGDDAATRDAEPLVGPAPAESD